MFVFCPFSVCFCLFRVRFIFVPCPFLICFRSALCSLSCHFSCYFYWSVFFICFTASLSFSFCSLPDFCLYSIHFQSVFNPFQFEFSSFSDCSLTVFYPCSICCLFCSRPNSDRFWPIFCQFCLCHRLCLFLVLFFYQFCDHFLKEFFCPLFALFLFLPCPFSDCLLSVF